MSRRRPLGAGYSFCAGAEVLGVGSNFRDCADCPEMVIVPAGEFVMGSPGTEPDRSATEGPQRKVAVRKPFAMGRFEVTRGQLAAFVRETGHQSAGCRLWSQRDQWRVERTRDWRDPGFAQTDEHPVTCINWYDARAYAGWLSRRAGRRYRLPSAPVGALRPNAFGLHDTLGSVLRGGAWFTAPRLTRSASRFRDHRVHRFYFYGFRVAADP